MSPSHRRRWPGACWRRAAVGWRRPRPTKRSAALGAKGSKDAAPPPLLVVLTGPSGVGKDSLIARLKELLPGAYFGVNATTRPPRPGEAHGRDYFFLSEAEFRDLIDRGELLEHALVYGQYKGVPRAPVREALAAGRDVVLRTDIQGARYIRSAVPGAFTVFVSPPSRAELERRLREREADSEEQIALRLKTAEEELAAAEEFDARVVNDDLEACARRVLALIEQERARPGRPPPRV